MAKKHTYVCADEKCGAALGIARPSQRIVVTDSDAPPVIVRCRAMRIDPSKPVEDQTPKMCGAQMTYRETFDTQRTEETYFPTENEPQQGACHVSDNAEYPIRAPKKKARGGS